MSVFGTVLAVSVAIAAASTAQAHPSTRPVTDWVRNSADLLTTVDPGAGLGDLAPIRRSVGDADIVGLGESVHGAAEELTLNHRTLRFLVEQMGFRSVAWEEDWTLGLEIDEYIQGGAGDLDRLVGQLGPQWQSRQTADVLRWLRAYNVSRADKVRFVGVDFFLTPPRAYDAVEAHVAAAAPQRLPELRRHLQVIRPCITDVPPCAADMYGYIGWFESQPDQQRFVRHARQARDLVGSLPHRSADRRHADSARALQLATQILWFYEHFSLPDSESLAFRDAHVARNVTWWRGHVGGRIAYWAASPHTANAPGLRIARPPEPELRFPSTGSYLRGWYGDRYRSIGFTFDHGTVGLAGAQTFTMPPPSPGWFEHPFGHVGADQFVLDLRTPAPPLVRRWLHGAITTRGLPDGGPGSFMDGGSPSQWFDVIVHRQVVTPLLPCASGCRSA